MSISKDMNCKVVLHGRKEITNTYGQKDFEYGPIKTLWAEVLPESGALKNYQGDTQFAEISHKFRIRPLKSIKITNDMFFMFKGQRYDVKYYNPNYKKRDRIEIFCSLVVE